MSGEHPYDPLTLSGAPRRRPHVGATHPRGGVEVPEQGRESRCYEAPSTPRGERSSLVQGLWRAPLRLSGWGERGGRAGPARREAGFTLVELLVAIGIIAVLAGLIFPAMGAAKRSASAKATKATIERVKLACEAYFADFGDYPPTSLAALGVSTNGVNDGSEALLRCLTTRLGRGPYLQFEEKELVNTDDDALARGDPCKSTIESRALYELADAWGNPLIYFHNRDYQGGPKLERYMTATGERVTCKPKRSEKTGQFPCPTTFMIWSVGADGVNQDGQGDDVCSWK